MRAPETETVPLSIEFEKGLYVRIQECPKGPHPKPLASGFSTDREYRVVSIYNPSESGECWLLISNDREELWFISQRHVRTTRLDTAATELSRALRG